MTIYSATDVSNLTPCSDENVHTYATSEELKKNTFILNCQNIIQTICIKLTLRFQMKIQKGVLSAIYDYFLITDGSFFSFCWNETVSNYVTGYELQKETFALNRQNVITASGIHMNFTL